MIQNEFNFEAAFKDGFNLFLGSEFPCLSQDITGRNLPTNYELSLELAEKFNVPSFASGDLIKVYPYIENLNPVELKAYLKERFSVETFSDKYKILDYLPIKSIITMNIDNLLYKITEGSPRHYVNNISINGPSFRDRIAIDFIPLQGVVTDIQTEHTFSMSAINLHPDKWNVIIEKFSLFPTIFLGFGLNDINLLSSLKYNSSIRKSKDRWIVIPKSEAQLDVIKFFETLGFQIIIFEFEEFLEHITRFAINDPIVYINSDLNSTILFPDDVVPDINKITVRTNLEFYQGAAPQWSDIYSGNLHKTKHFNTMRNIINSGNHGIMIGIPGCGKTTLLMQLAVEDFMRSYKLINVSMTLDKAKLIINRLQGARAIIFMDNFTDSLDAFNLLSSMSNIQVIGSDRDYNFGIVNHLIEKGIFKIHNVTDISQDDIQKCFNSLPDSIRENRFSNPRISKELEPSLFEIMQVNVRGAKLKDRYLSVLNQLSINDIRLAEILVLICYLERSRTPTTMDILLSYCREFISDYKEMYTKCDSLNKLISDGTGLFDLRNTDIDYFSPRSIILSEAIMDNVSPSLLKTVLNTFIKNVSPYRIIRYDVFKKSAFDHKIISKAFHDFNEGIRFYESVYEIDKSPYILQQEALYLSSKHQYVRAFTVIDKALTESGRRIWSIRNSHAIILFKANIQHHTQQGAREILIESMEILKECYKWDKRRPFHTYTFADQAIKFWEAYQDEIAHEYLIQARTWLFEEKKSSPWNKTISRLLPKVERCLQ